MLLKGACVCNIHFYRSLDDRYNFYMVKYQPDSVSTQQTTLKRLSIRKIDFHWFIADQWDCEKGKPQIQNYRFRSRLKNPLWKYLILIGSCSTKRVPSREDSRFELPMVDQFGQRYCENQEFNKLLIHNF